MNILIAQAREDQASRILENTLESSATLRTAIDTTWQQTIKGPLFVALGDVGAIIAVVFIGFWFISWVKILVSDDAIVGPHALQELIVPILLLFLLGNPTNRGNLLGETILNSNKVMQNISDYVIVSLRQDIKDFNPVHEAAVQMSATRIYRRATKDCLKYEFGDKNRRACLLDADQKIFDLLYPYRTRDWYREFREQVKIPVQLLSTGIPDIGEIRGQDPREVSHFLTGLSDVVSDAVTAILFGMGVAFVIAIEHAKLLTALVAPVFLGASILPVPGKPITWWGTTYSGLGLLEILYKTLVGLGSLSILNAGPTDPLIFPLVISLFGIFIAILLAGGGGIALFSGIARMGTAGLPRRY
ncbi:hypothetical protein [Acaryochloris marina]|uniref:hypothetical protein n=1 Tax=Acaryochloris marina TaxID=155978 RepID=UPI0021C3A90E|nr:hypothetical protein [Acaryochloris marina]BDM83175.1 hypothetical protein AM10699_60360 [Acaryochloris marina MBIC10699]